MRTKVAFLLLGLASLTPAMHIVPLGDSSMDVITDVSFDGKFFLAKNIRFDIFAGLNLSLPMPPGSGNGQYRGMSGNAQVQIGEFQDQSFAWKGYTRRNGAFTQLEGLGGPFTTPFDCSYDGRTVVGEIWDASNFIRPAIWIDNQISVLDGGEYHRVSGDGRVAFGKNQLGQLTYWDQGVATVYETPELAGGQLQLVNHSGHAAVGSVGNDAFVWRRGTGVQLLGHLPLPGDLSSIAYGISADGQIVTGHTNGSSQTAFIKIGDQQLQTVEQYLASQGISTNGWELRTAVVSADGEAVVGTGRYLGQDRFFHVWVKGQHLTLDVETDAIKGGKGFKGTVSFTDLAPHPRIVTLTSHNPGVVIPATITVPANSRIVNFYGTVTVGTTAGDHRVTATSGSLSCNVSVPVRSMISRFEFTPIKVHGGMNARARITLDSLSPWPVTVYIQQVEGGISPVHYQTTVPPMTLTTDVPIRIEDRGGYYSGEIEAQTSVPNLLFEARRAIAAIYSPLRSFTVSPNPVRGGTSATARIVSQLAAPATGLTYKLRSLSQLLTVPANAVMPSGTLEVTFNVGVSPVTTNAVRSIEARIGTVVKTCAVTITP